MEKGVLGAQWTHCENGPWDKLATGQVGVGGVTPTRLAVFWISFNDTQVNGISEFM